MTDTGQIPGEGQPESAGMVEQPGVPGPGAYTYLAEAPAEDEDLLLLPGAQGAWGNEVPPPAPEPIVEAGPPARRPRDGRPGHRLRRPHGVRLPEQGPGPYRRAHEAPTAVQPPRRPLHLGPPIPDASASPVRSLADRGPAGRSGRHSGPWPPARSTSTAAGAARPGPAGRRALGRRPGGGRGAGRRNGCPGDGSPDAVLSDRGAPVEPASSAGRRRPADRAGRGRRGGGTGGVSPCGRGAGAGDGRARRGGHPLIESAIRARGRSGVRGRRRPRGGGGRRGSRRGRRGGSRASRRPRARGRAGG